MGVIQPSRTLTHAGSILPGVRRVLQVPSPAAGQDWIVVVPAGVQWWILGGVASLTTDATVANRLVNAIATVDGLQIWNVQTAYAQAASLVLSYTFESSGGLFPGPNGGNREIMPFPGAELPQGSVFGVHTANLDAADQWSNISLWVEEYYFTNAQLSELERSKEQAVREWIHEEIQQAQTGRS